jgi:hypothetical protein
MRATSKSGICIGWALLTQLAFLYLAYHESARGDHFVALPIGYDSIFPFYFVIIGCIGWSNWAFIMLIFQWLIYGWVIGLGWELGRFKKFAFAVLGAHIVTAFIGFWLYGK